MAMDVGSPGLADEVEVLCRPLEHQPGSLDFSSSGGGLRCRFTAKDATLAEFPALTEEDGASIYCRCSSKTLGEHAEVSVLLANGGELVCEALKKTKDDNSPAEGLFKRLSLLDRYLFVWILVDMVLAIVIGYYAKGIKERLQVVKLAGVSLPIAVGLWVMMYPVLCKVRYEVLFRMANWGLGRNIVLSLMLNWLLGPALMTGLAWATLPDLQGYRSGVILVGMARCIAMVLIWNELAKGDGQLCAILVAINSIMQMVLYTPLSLFYLKVVSRSQGVDVSAWEIARSVLLFLGVPLAAGFVTRYSLRYTIGRRWYDKKFVPFIAPWALIGLLYTIFVMFSIQARQIVGNIGDVARVAVPMLLYFSITFFSSVWVCRRLGIQYSEAVTQSFTASSNNFELAIAVAVGSFGIDSKEALAATIGPLIEVPVLLGLVYVSLKLRKVLFLNTDGPANVLKPDVTKHATNSD
eukprot:TRINITY_DN8490_c0_g2_i1.p1 TRINITY_DN8490_c0_g2~~TRINITY_DN8490_c0_g2_i1.p1  ORF type:complete len:466 (+),score=43.87 TRINITY_DN8490_c0_g2_i1:263-1660(+)